MKQNLRFPGKLIVFEMNGKQVIAISDSGNNRIVLIDAATGVFMESIGSKLGQEGMEDGEFDKATFNHPQGLCFSQLQSGDYGLSCVM